MSHHSVIYKGTAAFICLCILLCIIIPMFTLRKVKPGDRKDFFSLLFLLVPLGTFLLWLLWVCMYISQLNPMLSPIRLVHKEGAHVAEQVKAAVEQAAAA